MSTSGSKRVAHIADEKDSINILELGMMMMELVIIMLGPGQSRMRNGYISVHGDNATTVWINRYRGNNEPQSGVLVRRLGVLEIVNWLERYGAARSRLTSSCR